MLKSTGSRTEPWGTPLIISFQYQKALVWALLWFTVIVWISLLMPLWVGIGSCVFVLLLLPAQSNVWSIDGCDKNVINKVNELAQ